MEEEEWNALRKEATKIMSSLSYEENQQLQKRRWIERNWPEKSVRWQDKGLLADTGKCVSESFVRYAEDNNEHFMLHDVVERSLNKLYKITTEPAALDLENLKDVPDLDLLKALPSLVSALRYSVIQSIFSALNGGSKKPKNRAWLEKEIQRKINILLGECQEALPDGLKQVLGIVRNMQGPKRSRGGFGMYTASGNLKGFKSSPKIIPQMPESSRESAQLALQNLEDLPIRCLHAMCDLISGRSYKRIQVYSVKYGRNRRELAKIIRIGAEKLLSEARDTRLPQPLQKALRVVSLFAMEVYGHDGNLSEKLGTQAQETESLQKRLLAAISQLRNLSFQDLEEVYQKLVQGADTRYRIKHPRVYLESVRGILQEVLYRCTAHTVPESVEEALDIIMAAKPQRTKCVKVPDRQGDPSLKAKHVKAETEALFNLSSQLQQIAWEWIEASACSVPDEDEIIFQTPAKKQKVDKSDAMPDASDDSLNDYSLSQLKSKGHPQKPMASSSKKQEEMAETASNPSEDPNDYSLPSQTIDPAFEPLEDTEESVDHMDAANRDITEVADEGAALAYVIIGRAMEECFRSSSGHFAREYLRSDLDASEDDAEAEETEEVAGSRQNEVDLLMRVIEKIPSVPRSVLDNIKLRLANSSFLKQKVAPL